MEPVELYKQDSIEKRILLEFPSVALTCDEVQEDMTLTHQVNEGEDLEIGSAGAAELTFNVIDFEGEVTALGLAGQELRYRAGILTGEQSRLALYRKLRSYLVCPDGAFAYAAYKTKPHLRVWDISGEPVRTTDPVQPPRAPQALFLHEGTLYCAFMESPFLAAYTATDGVLTPKATPTLSAFDTRRLERYCKEERAFCLRGDTLQEYCKTYRNLAVEDLIEKTFAFADVGRFRAEKPERRDDRITTVKAYDRMTCFEITVGDWIESLTYPLTLKIMLVSLCAKVGVPLASTDFLNSEYWIQRNFHGEGITGRQIVQWAAQIAAGFARITPAGELELARYAERAYQLTPYEHSAVTVAEYTTAPVDKLQIRVTDNDIGVIVGTGTNALIIENNPLLYAESDAELRPVAQSILDAIKGISYVPYTLIGKGNPLVRAGDIIAFTSSKGSEVRALVMNRRLKGVQALKDEYSATGGQRRATQSSAVNRQIVMLRGRVNELVFTVDETVNRLYDAKTGDITVLQLTAKSLQTQIADANGNISSLQQTATSLQTQLTNSKGDIGTLQLTAKSLQTQITGANGNISSLQQTAISLQTQVTNSEGDISKLQQTVSGFELAVNNKKLTFDANGLTIYGAGFKIMNSSNVQVFGISADGYINMLGSLTTESAGMKTIISGGKIQFYKDGDLGGAIYGGRTPSGNATSITIDAQYLEIKGKLWSLEVAGGIKALTGNISSLTCNSISAGNMWKSTATFVTGVYQYGTTISTSTSTISYWG